MKLEHLRALLLVGVIGALGLKTLVSHCLSASWDNVGAMNAAAGARERNRNGNLAT